MSISFLKWILIPRSTYSFYLPKNCVGGDGKGKEKEKKDSPEKQTIKKQTNKTQTKKPRVFLWKETEKHIPRKKVKNNAEYKWGCLFKETAISLRTKEAINNSLDINKQNLMTDNSVLQWDISLTL